MRDSLITIAYIAASALFILSLGGLSRQETARRGNLYGILGMLIALVATAARMDFGSYAFLAAVLIPGAGVGVLVASRVQMTAMPQLVAILHSFVGAAAVLVGFATYLGHHEVAEGEATIHLAEIFIGVCIGAITFTGSVIAFGKLQGKITGRPLLIPGRHLLNLLMLFATFALGVWFMRSPGVDGQIALGAATVLTGILGVHFVLAIGGADMPVVVSMLNSYSGWAAAAAGFMLSNDLLIITGALVGSSGAILSYIMCRGMNRSFLNVMLGGFGTESGASPAAGEQPAGEVRSIDAGQAAELLNESRKIVIVPGYGLAVAQAQHALAEVVRMLREKGADVRFAIHPVAGRLPGHMNVLLAEANIPYDIVFEMEEINDSLKEMDVVLVIGANDIVNPSAMEDPTSPIAGMPVLRVWEARTVVVMKRSMASGYAGVDNPLFYRENTQMLFGDARKVVDAILAAMRS
ncbi:MAG: NAD(P)(+) transhydrogenase (Re/Si-specific) subunit beta [Acidobacteria bacterium]|nr:NAD(P)(+) transhydrogenase (Re/Si-specific) subunit beta [Acidobacteriota bacterium]MCA1637523.1 NAD(P)(+) transhydrogenase (Re/Si-specific) subunit beta [Acidobacteriota bacterium]